MQHSHSNDDTCFRMDVIDEVIEEELNALLKYSEPFLSTSEKINETSLDEEFAEFMAVEVEVEEIPEQEEEVNDNFEELPLGEQLFSSFGNHIRSLKADEKKQLVSVLKNHKEAFSWKIFDIPGITPSFCNTR
ncbi:hypothetical protein Tco_1330782 [Tanacetum coccineum]